MKINILFISLIISILLLCQLPSKEVALDESKVKESSSSFSNCRTTSFQKGKVFPTPNLGLPKEFGDGREFFPSFQCFNELKPDSSFDYTFSSSLNYLVTKKNNLIIYMPSSCYIWQENLKSCAEILLFELIDEKYVLKKNYFIETLSSDKLEAIADDDDNLYLFTARKEDLSNIKNPKPIARKGVACIIKIDTKMDKVVFSTNLLGDPDLSDKDEFRHIFNPLHGGTVSLAYGDGKVFAFFAKLLGYDDYIEQRHQNSLFTAIDANTGKEFIGLNGYSHSFDQYITYDPESKSFLALELGDGFDRAIGLSILKIEQGKIKKKTTQAYLIPGFRGANETGTFIGNVVVTSKGYILSFSAEKEPLYPYSRSKRTHPDRTIDIGLIRILKNLPNKESYLKNANVDPTWKGEINKVIQDVNEVTNSGIRWITNVQKREQLDFSRIFALDTNTLLLVYKTDKIIFTLMDLDGKILKSKEVSEDESHDKLSLFYDQVGNPLGVTYLASNQEQLVLVLIDKKLDAKRIPIIKHL